MTTLLSYIIAYSGTYSRILSVGMAVWRWPYLRGGVRLFACLEVLNLCFAVYSTLTINKGNNSYLEFICLGIDALFMGFLFGPLMPSKRSQWAVLLFGPLFAVSLVVDYWWGEGLRQVGSNYASALECAFTVVFVLVYLNSLLQQQPGSLRRFPMAIISGCLLLISLIALPVYLFGPALMSYSMTLTLRAYDVLYLSAFIVHVGYGYAFWLTKWSGSERATIAI